jgi:hypothetical protein
MVFFFAPTAPLFVVGAVVGPVVPTLPCDPSVPAMFHERVFSEFLHEVEGTYRKTPVALSAHTRTFELLAALA